MVLFCMQMRTILLLIYFYVNPNYAANGPYSIEHSYQDVTNREATSENNIITEESTQDAEIVYSHYPKKHLFLEASTNVANAAEVIFTKRSRRESPRRKFLPILCG